MIVEQGVDTPREQGVDTPREQGADTPREQGADLEREEGALIERVLAGDEAAFRSLYRAHATPLYRLALRLCGGRDESAEDVLQEAWSRAARRLDDFERRSSLRSWLNGFVVRCSLERTRWERRGGDDLSEADAWPAPARDRAAERVDLERAFEALPAGYRSVLVLHDLQGYTHKDIGELLGVSPGTSKSQLSRARAWMRRALGQDYGVE
jgi:RNA polymerase sigma-70 factor (ECF subfamily)